MVLQETNADVGVGKGKYTPTIKNKLKFIEGMRTNKAAIQL